MMGARDYAGPYTFGYPHANYKVAHLGTHASQVMVVEAKPCRILRVHPKGVSMRDLVEPFCVSRSRMNQRGKPKCRNKYVVVACLIQFAPVDVTSDITGYRVLRPLPVGHRGGIKLESARWSIKASQGLPVAHYSDRLFARRCLFDEAARIINASPLKLQLSKPRLMLFIDVRLHCEGAVAPHEIQR